MTTVDLDARAIVRAAAVLPDRFPAAMTPVDEPVHGDLVSAAPGWVLPGDLVLYAQGARDWWLRVADVRPGVVTTVTGFRLEGERVWVWPAADVLEAIGRGAVRVVKCVSAVCGRQTLLESVLHGWFCPDCEARRLPGPSDADLLAEALLCETSGGPA